jgi:hypothetical protein
MTFKEWLKLVEAAAVAGTAGEDGTEIPQFPGEGTWQGAAAGGTLKSVGPVKIKKAERKGQKKQ